MSLLCVVLALTLQPGISQKPELTRREFFQKIARVEDGMTREQVQAILGAPDHKVADWNRPPGPNNVTWLYGADGPNSFAVRGHVVFASGRVMQTWGKGGTPPSHTLISDEELERELRALWRPSTRREIFEHDPLRIVRAVNRLHPLGKEKALAVMLEYSRLTPDENWLFWTLRVLFDPPDDRPVLPRPGLGAYGNNNPNYEELPRYPILLHADIPFGLYRGAVLMGMAEPFENHAEYFAKHCKLRQRPLRPPDDPFPSCLEVLKLFPWLSFTDQNGTLTSSRDEHYEGLLLRDVLSLVESAYQPEQTEEERHRYITIRDYDRYHREFLATGAKWDEKKHLYVRADGTTWQFVEPIYEPQVAEFNRDKGIQVSVKLKRNNPHEISISIHYEWTAGKHDATVEVLDPALKNVVYTTSLYFPSSKGGNGAAGTGFDLPVNSKVKVRLRVSGKVYTSPLLVP